ncbi:helix-turn-helix transcriptional regulator [Ruficoccus amylovorans]|uniref:Helix-turn-helix transcriptional regulator n=1 Tax=Ruficoccus amylovorans TaxID=1804625 RepID=A0A842HIM5_9BACT|nr:AraC family transcriptional regulator [Ruficoccus amylovorans]MBC2596000.1 helix-turn-helix transcriptional regulator [Ruficoccus amylovorans]
MILRYLSCDIRDFSTFPDLPSCRYNWEFFISFRGECRPVFENEFSTSFHERSLWLLRPQEIYHWIPKGTRSHRAVFQFADVPDILKQLVGNKLFIRKSITDEEAALIESLALELRHYYDEQTDRLYLASLKAVAQLSLILTADMKFDRQIRLDTIEANRVLKAENFYREHLRANPSVNEVAAHVGISSSQLRRHFRGVRNESPHEAFTRLRLIEAKRLLTNTDLTLDQIALLSGFASLVDFHRIFKTSNKLTPTAWRRTSGYHLNFQGTEGIKTKKSKTKKARRIIKDGFLTNPE